MRTLSVLALAALSVSVSGVPSSVRGGEEPPRPPTIVDAIVGLRDAVGGLPEKILKGDPNAQRRRTRAERKLERAVEVAMSDVRASEVKAYGVAAGAAARLIKSGLDTLFDEELEAFVAAARAGARSSVATIAEKVEVYDDALGFLGRRVVRLEELEDELDGLLKSDDLPRFLKRTKVVLRKGAKLMRRAEKIIDRIMVEI